MSVTALAKAAGVSRVAAHNRLSGRSRWQVEELAALAAAWGTSVDELIREDVPA